VADGRTGATDESDDSHLPRNEAGSRRRRFVVSRGLWTRKLAIEERRISVSSPLLAGVVSDTHGSASPTGRSFDFVSEFFQRAGVDLILHAGDAGHVSVLERLERVAPVVAVRGNADPHDLIETLPDRVWMQAGARSVLLLHGHHGKTALKAARGAADPAIDLIVFGHSHKPLIDWEGETILFNPGSPVERRWNPHFGLGLIRISDEKVEPELILFDDRSHLENIEL
jgi:putative phosphoesterase